MANFFINRPIFAWVIAIVIMLAGSLSIMNLPVSQYPPIAPPAIAINATYPGASAQTVEDSVTQVIEQQLTGLDGLLYFNSTSDSFGSTSITLTFSPDTDPDIAQVQVQNKLQLAMPRLPLEVQEQGVRVAKSARNFLMVIGFVSSDGAQDATDLADFLASSVQDPLSRVTGVGEVQVFGSQYAMRVWLDPDKLIDFHLSANDVRQAIEAQNAQVTAGQLGGTPALPGQGFSATITAQSLLQTAEQFENILLRSSTGGGEVRLRDVAKVEIGAENYGTLARYNGQPAAGIGIRLASDANALETAQAVRDRVEELSAIFPAGVEAVVPYDTSPFVKVSIEKVVYTMLEAIVLVFLVMFLFLQNIRATLIPTFAIPVVLLGTFGIMAAFGFSINMLTMFGMVLSIGLLVDDAIVVVENVERIMVEEGLSPKEAAKKSMSQITGALVGIGLVLSAVFVPMAFFGGSTGVIYRQFSITIVSAMGLSVLVAIIFTPALCATMLKQVEKGHSHAEGSWFAGFFRWFNGMFDRNQKRYVSSVEHILRRSGRFMLIYLVICGVIVLMFMRMPTSFLPEEDQGVMFNQITLPAGATQERTLEVLEKVENHFLENEADTVESIFTVAGFSFSGRGQNMGIGFINLKPWEERTQAGMQVKEVAARAMGAFSQIREAMVFAFVPPAVLELGTSGGFTVQLQDLAGHGHAALTDARNQFLGMAAEDPRLTNVRPNGMEDTPEFRLDIDHARAGALGVSIADINSTLSSAWGGTYVNDFLDRGRIKRVYIQGEAEARMLPEDFDKWYVRNNQGEMVPFSAFASTHWGYGPPRLERFNGQSSIELQGEAAPGLSSGEAMQAVEEIMARLPGGFGHSWSGTSYEERQSGAQAPALFALSILIVFLCLAALYESWSIPFAVMLVVPLGVIGALMAATGRGMSNDIYVQVGLLAIIGLSSKNAILIVEFAKNLMEEGHDMFDATLTAAKMRLRPILMTSLAFGLGVVPLAIATGAGAGSQNAIGTSVFGGTFTATVLGIFFIPLFYVTILRIFGPPKSRRDDASTPETSPQENR